MTQTVNGPACPGACTIERRFATSTTDSGTACLDMSVSVQDDGTYRARWSMNRGRAWGKAYLSVAFATPAEALAFSARKWETLVALLATVAPVSGRGITSDMYTIVAR